MKPSPFLEVNHAGMFASPGINTYHISNKFGETVPPDHFTHIVYDVAPKPWEQINSELEWTEN